MIEVYAFATPNSVKVPIALEELDLSYELHAVNVRQGEQKLPAYVALNPNAKVPVLVDPDGLGGERLVLTESAAILVYLAEKTGKLLPTSGVGRARVFEQLFFHASGLSPAFGQAGFFNRHAEPQPIAIARFMAETERTVGVLDDLLGRQPYVAGDAFTIADIAHFGWLWRREFPGIDLANQPNVARWYDEIAARPAVVRALGRVNALIPTV